MKFLENDLTEKKVKHISDKRDRDNLDIVFLFSFCHSVCQNQNCRYFLGRNISQIFLEIFSDFLRNFFRISQNFFKHFLRFSVGFGTLMWKWEIFPKHSFSIVFWNYSPILFLNSQRFPHHFSDFLWFLNNTLTYRKAKNKNTWDFSKALTFQNFSEYLEGFFEFFRFSQNCRVLSSAGFAENMKLLT